MVVKEAQVQSFHRRQLSKIKKQSTIDDDEYKHLFIHLFKEFFSY